MNNDKGLSRRRFTLLAGKLLAALATFLSMPAQALSKLSLSEDSLSNLKQKISGEVISQSHRYYETFRLGLAWQQLKTERRPEVMVQPKSVNDVVHAVQFASDNNIQIGIRSGGHSWVDSSIRDGGMLLDLRHFRDIEIDVKNRTAIVGPAITARELVTKLEELLSAAVQI
mgnify:CR=1 FL=1